jgi:putative endonuclease
MTNVGASGALLVSKTHYVYIMASQKNGTTYIGVTNDIVMRSTQHREGKGRTFTVGNRVHRLVYYEEYADVREAIVREKQMKKWNRQWKINLIEKNNPEWRDLWFDLNR